MAPVREAIEPTLTWVGVTPGAADPVAVLAVDDEPEEGLVVVLGEVEFEQLAISAEASNTAPMAAGTRTFDPPVRCRIYPPCSVPVAADRNLSCLSACPRTGQRHLHRSAGCGVNDEGNRNRSDVLC